MMTLSYDPSYRGQRSKCVIFSKFLNATLPTYYIARSCNLVRMTSGLVATKSINNLTSGHVGVTGVKKVNHVKNMKTALISKLIMSFCRQ